MHIYDKETEITIDSNHDFPDNIQQNAIEMGPRAQRREQLLEEGHRMPDLKAPLDYKPINKRASTVAPAK